jgi:hypothetical protein
VHCHDNIFFPLLQFFLGVRMRVCWEKEKKKHLHVVLGRGNLRPSFRWVPFPIVSSAHIDLEARNMGRRGQENQVKREKGIRNPKEKRKAFLSSCILIYSSIRLFGVFLDIFYTLSFCLLLPFTILTVLTNHPMLPASFLFSLSFVAFIRRPSALVISQDMLDLVPFIHLFYLPERHLTIATVSLVSISLSTPYSSDFPSTSFTFERYHTRSTPLVPRPPIPLTSFPAC